jgi:apolipoprotein D and lipocalin family protein
MRERQKVTPMKYRILALASLLALVGCAGYAKSGTRQPGIMPVRHFDSNRYLGKWYELGRIENRFERGLTNTTASYSLNRDGTIKVVNAGYDPGRGKHREAVGKAKFLEGKDVGALKVSFFPPFYGGYTIVALDEDYQWAIVVGPNPRKYFWVLSRQSHLTERLKKQVLKVARDLNVDPTTILWVPQQGSHRTLAR